MVGGPVPPGDTGASRTGRPFTAFTTLAGAIALGPFALGIAAARGSPSFTPLGWAAVLYIGTFGAALGYALWVWALERTTPTRVAVCLALNPLAAAVLAAAFLHEPLTARFLLGVAFVLAGIFATNHPAADA